MFSEVDQEILLSDVHLSLPLDTKAVLCKGHYKYYHYGCDGTDDRGWGCGYRTLQTLCSWVRHHHQSVTAISGSKIKNNHVPSLTGIQTALIEMKDKPESFLHSKQWIGSFEVCLILDHFYDVPCKILHINKGSDIDQFLPELQKHFETIGSPVMMGGESDNASKGIMGVRLERDPALLLVDPHFFGEGASPDKLLETGCVKWLPISDLHANTFYNMCLPKVSSR